MRLVVGLFLLTRSFLWLRYGSEPPTEMQSPYEIFSGDPSINTNSHLYNTGASSLRRTVSTANLAEFTKFDETPLYFPAGSLTQQPTSRNSANAGNSDFKDDLYLVAAREFTGNRGEVAPFRAIRRFCRRV